MEKKEKERDASMKTKMMFYDRVEMIVILAALIISMFFAMGSTRAHAVEWHTANQITVEWDAYTDVTAPDVLKYGVYTRMLPSGAPVLLHEQDTTVVTITFQAEGRYVVGVTSIRYVGSATGERIESEVNWSDVNGESTPVPFGASYFIVPGHPIGLRKQVP